MRNDRTLPASLKANTMKLLFLPLAVLTLSACSASQGNEMTGSNSHMTLCIENATSGYGKIEARTRLVDFDVPSGQTVCKEMNDFGGQIPIQARTESGGLAGRRYYSATIEPVQGACWLWTLTGSEASSSNVRPCNTVSDASSPE